MKNKFNLIIMFIISLNSYAGTLTQFVDTRIGTAASPTITGGAKSERRGNTQPSAVLPFGMIQWGPDTENQIVGSYVYDDKNIKGFSLTHISGPGCKNAGDVSILPFTGKKPGLAAFSHSSELAQPGFYSVVFDNGIKVEITSTERSGFGRFVFPKSLGPSISIKTRRSGTGLHGGKINILDSNRVSGWAKGGDFCNQKNIYKLYFAIEFDRAIVSNRNVMGNSILRFDNSEQIQMKVGISYVSEENAWLNLKTENNGWDFEGIKELASKKWEKALSKIEIQDNKLETKKRIFYTALYHSLLHPNIFNDVNGEYIGFDGKIHTTKGTKYVNFSSWDTYRTQTQLLAVLFPKVTSDIIKSLIEDARQCGAFPRWSNNNADTGVMIGDPGSLIVANAYAFGVRDFNTSDALNFMKKSGLEPQTACNGFTSRPGLKEYLELGFIPRSLSIFRGSDNYSALWLVKGAVSATLEYATADFAVAQFADSLGDKGTAKIFFTHANNWKNHFDPQTKYLRPRYKNKSWVKRFDPAKQNAFAEGNSAQYTWMVPFASKELVGLMGGEKIAQDRLDFFVKELNVWAESPHLWIGNQPGFGVPWMYYYTGAPHKTQDVLRRIMNETFSDQADGLPGNDDLGALSSWYVLASLGLYPSVPGVGGFILSKPLFLEMEINLDSGAKIKLKTVGSDKGYINAVTLNNNPYSKTWIPWSSLEHGGEIMIGTGEGLSTWGTSSEDMPPSYSDYQSLF